jgi:GTP-binding protein
MAIAQVAIIGRPNVGKSSIFNWLASQRISIVDDRPGVTRDRLTYLMPRGERIYELVDTGGMGIEDEDQLTAHVEEQIQTAIQSASLILFVVDAATGLVPLDLEVARRLRKVTVPVILVANKCDNQRIATQADEFHRLVFSLLLKVSVVQNRGREELLEAIHSELPEGDLDSEIVPEAAVMKVAIVGRRNVGKSTFVNALLEQPRMITSETPGTTRDSVDVRFQMDDQTMIAIDTPGLRRKKSLASDVEYYGLKRAEKSIRRADVVFLFFDAAEKISKVEKQLCNYIVDYHKPCVFVVNKWDLYAGKVATQEWADYLFDTFRNMPWVPVAFVTALTGKNIKKLINHGQMLFKQSRQRIGTGPLNRLIRAAIEYQAPPNQKGRRAKIYFATQAAIQPPTIVLFCNDPDLIDQRYRRYLLRVIRENFDFSDVPIQLLVRGREGHALAEIHQRDPDLEESWQL